MTNLQHCPHCGTPGTVAGICPPSAREGTADVRITCWQCRGIFTPTEDGRKPATGTVAVTFGAPNVYRDGTIWIHQGGEST